MHTKISRRRRLNYKTAALAHCNTDKKLRNLSYSLVALKETVERSRKSFLTSCNKTNNVSFCMNLLPFYRNSFTHRRLVSLFPFSISCFPFSIPGEIFLRVLCLFHGIDKMWRSTFLSSLFSHSCKICLIAVSQCREVGLNKKLGKVHEKYEFLHVIIPWTNYDSFSIRHNRTWRKSL